MWATGSVLGNTTEILPPCPRLWIAVYTGNRIKMHAGYPHCTHKFISVQDD